MTFWDFPEQPAPGKSQKHLKKTSESLKKASKVISDDFLKKKKKQFATIYNLHTTDYRWQTIDLQGLQRLQTTNYKDYKDLQTCQSTISQNFPSQPGDPQGASGF